MSLIVALGLSLLVLAVLTGWGLLLNRRWNQRMKRVEPLLRELVERYGRPDLTLSTGQVDLTLSTGQVDLLVSRDFIHYLNLKRVVIEATFPMRKIVSLQIVESSPRSVRFCFDLPDDRETKTVWTDDISRFAELFNIMIDSGKEIRYLRG